MNEGRLHLTDSQQMLHTKWEYWAGFNFIQKWQGHHLAEIHCNLSKRKSVHAKNVELSSESVTSSFHDKLAEK